MSDSKHGITSAQSFGRKLAILTLAAAVALMAAHFVSVCLDRLFVWALGLAKGLPDWASHGITLVVALAGYVVVAVRFHRNRLRHRSGLIPGLIAVFVGDLCAIAFHGVLPEWTEHSWWVLFILVMVFAVSNGTVLLLRPVFECARTLAQMPAEDWKATVRRKRNRRRQEEKNQVEGLVLLVSADPGVTVSQPKDAESHRCDIAHKLNTKTMTVSLDRACSLKADIEKVGGLPRLKWQQLMRAIEPHTSTLKQVWLVGSTKSLLQLGDCKRLLEGYVGPGVIQCYGQAIDFEDHEAMMGAFRKIVFEDKDKMRKIANHRKAIDFTGGTKVASVAATNITLRDAVVAQYVQTSDPAQPGDPPAAGRPLIAMIYDLVISEAHPGG